MTAIASPAARLSNKNKATLQPAHIIAGVQHAAQQQLLHQNGNLRSPAEADAAAASSMDKSTASANTKTDFIARIFKEISLWQIPLR